VASAYPYQQNLGYFAAFMRGYGRADYPTRAELWRDTQAYSGGAETAQTLYVQTSQLLGVPLPVNQR
jgi:hypothetical protein